NLCWIHPMNEREIFTEALDRSDPFERAAYLDRACGDDPALRSRLEQLLESHGRDVSLLERRPAELLEALGVISTGDGPAAPQAASHRTVETGTVIAGRYTLVEVIGEGGMGSVYLARQTDPVKREVALKLVKTGKDSRSVLARFEAERQALALMDHPN